MDGGDAPPLQLWSVTLPPVDVGGAVNGFWLTNKGNEVMMCIITGGGGGGGGGGFMGVHGAGLRGILSR